MTSLYHSQQNDIVAYDLRGQGGQMEVKMQTSTYLPKIWNVRLVGDFKPLETLIFSRGGHWR